MGLLMTASASGAAAQDPENTLYMDLESGRVVIQMRPDLAPEHVARIKELAREGFYDGIV
ncbi:MAG: peptidylprolyl isomerase, partial [Pseudomonadota bacterium]|nr:peptidylprolyl isomerase [Pseudomonadota bacterium]